MAQSAPNDPRDGHLAEARARMVDSQLRPNKVSDRRLLNAMRHLKRERFPPKALHALAYADDNIDLGGGRVMLQPMVLARMVQAAAPLAGETALVVGAGTGYSAALLAALGCVVMALEEAAALLDLAGATLAAEAPAVTLVRGPLSSGWGLGAPYHLILAEGAMPEVSETLIGQLHRETGRLVTIVSDGRRNGYAALAEPTPAGVSVRALFDCICPLLPGFAQAPAFEF
jgi:protein-L-isoaspartate(D-aspartate) O-methyltransferase